MAHNLGVVLRSTSPASSDGSPHRSTRASRGRKAGEESLSKDKSFRRYAAGVDRALALFDTTLQEWADYISFLSRLHKALQSPPDGVSTVPRKFVVAKRLAQCLHPSLPSGVHQKALEVYSFIFAFIGVDGLGDDLAVYLPGIASTLTFASVSVRPLFLSLVEDHVLKLPTAALRPALKALILALLPGLEEETSDEFEKTLRILNRCKHSLSAAGIGEVFWQNFFLASITSPSRRHGVLAYLSRYLPRLGKTEPGLAASVDGESSQNAQLHELTTPEPGLLLRCFATGLSDEQALVQRAFLDLLVSHLPLHASIFRRQVPSDDLELLISAAVGVVLRRDMSLNRRLWSWFLGPDLVLESKADSVQPTSNPVAISDKHTGVDSPELASYFETCCVQPLIQTLKDMIAQESRLPSKVSRPFRIALSLMDRWEIGGPVVNAIFLPLIRGLRRYRDSAISQQDFDEVFRSANVFFDGVESILIWSKMLALVIPIGKAKDRILSDLDLAAFVVANFNVGEEEMVMLHMPLVSLAMLESLSQSGTKGGSELLSSLHDHEVRSSMFNLLGAMINMIPDRAFAQRGREPLQSRASLATESELNVVLDQVKAFFDHSQNAVELSKPPISAKNIGNLFLKLLSPMILTHITADVGGSDISSQIRVFALLVEKVPSFDGLDTAALVEALGHRLAVGDQPAGHLPFAFISQATVIFISLSTRGSSDQLIQSDDVTAVVPLLVRHLWSFLSFSSSQHHIETVRLLDDLQRLVWQQELVTSAISTLMVEDDTDLHNSYSPSQESLERFATLWTHKCNELKTVAGEPNAVAAAARRPVLDATIQSSSAFSSMLGHSMLSVLSVLREPHTEAHAWCRDWLQGVADLSSIFESILSPIRKSLSMGDNSDSTVMADWVEGCYDLMEILNHLVATQSEEQWRRFSQQPGHNYRPGRPPNMKVSDSESLQMSMVRLCGEIMKRYNLGPGEDLNEQFLRLQRVTLRLVEQLVKNSDHEPILTVRLDQLLVEQLSRPATFQSTTLQSDLLDALLLILNAKIRFARSQEVVHGPSSDEGAQDTRRGVSSPSPNLGLERLSEHGKGVVALAKPPEELLSCLLKGLANPLSQDVIRKWVHTLCQSTYLYTPSTFVILISIVERFCRQIEVCFDGMREQYEDRSPIRRNFESPLLHLLNGLDFVLARAHEQLLAEEEGLSTARSPEPQQGFFGSMVSGTQSSDANQARNTTNNNRLTVILCFQDALRTCFKVWSWQSLDTAGSVDTSASFQHASLKMRSRSRRILEHLLAAEPLEGIEVLAGIWVKAVGERETAEAASLLSLVHTLEGSRPHITIAAIFNAVYTRTNPTALNVNHKSTLSSNLQESELVTFMNFYAQSLEDDVLDEIWKDCTTFLRDVLGNPMPHRHILAGLIAFISILSAKMENTNFGEEWKMRRELGDLFVRLLAAIYTIKPQGSSREKTSRNSMQSGLVTGMSSDSVDQILDDNFSAFSSLLGESDRYINVMVNLVSNIIAPLLHARLFPQNLTSTTLSLLYKISKVPNATKAWKKELVDAFNDPRFFTSPLPIVKNGWLLLLHQLAIVEKGLLPELLSRLTAPTAAGIMFGVGAAAARLEADKKTQLNLRRVASVLLAVETDAFMAHLPTLQAKIEELLTASAISSPSSTTRSEIFMVIRALVLQSSSSTHSATALSNFWPILNTELRAAFSSFIEHGHDEAHHPSTSSTNSTASKTYTPPSLLQAAKLLDVLLLTNPEDFQPQQWLFVTDTIDAIYHRPEDDTDDRDPAALIDQVAQSIASSSISPPPLLPDDDDDDDDDNDDNDSDVNPTARVGPPLKSPSTHNTNTNTSTTTTTTRRRDSSLRKPCLSGHATRNLPETEPEQGHVIRQQLLRPFFAQLSIHVYERTYSLAEPDLEACREDLLADLWEERGIVGGSIVRV